MRRGGGGRVAEPTARFIDPEVLSRIQDLELLARTVVEGFIAGLHRSPFVGFSLDFAEHRPYMPGDDIRRIDWRLYARTDRFYVKEYEAETNAAFFLALDVSRSMDFGTAAVTKLEYARFLAASLAHLAGEQRDRVGIACFDDRIREHVPPAVRHRRTVLHAVDRARAGGAGALGAPLLRVAESLRRRGLVALVSDLYEAPGEVMAAVETLRAGGHDVLVFHLLDPAELTFPYEEATRFEDLETGEEIPVVPGTARETYRERVEAHTEELTRRMREAGVDYAVLDTSRPLDEALFRFLSHRARRRTAGGRGGRGGRGRGRS